MFSHSHLVAGILFSVIGYKLQIIGPLGAIVIPVVSVLIDLDHLLIYFFEKKKLNIKEFLNDVAEDHTPTHYRSFIHRSYFSLIILALTALLLIINKEAAYIIAASYFSHILLDKVSSINHWINIYKKNRIGNISIMLSKLEHIIDIAMVLAITLLLLYL